MNNIDERQLILGDHIVSGEAVRGEFLPKRLLFKTSSAQVCYDLTTSLIVSIHHEFVNDGNGGYVRNNAERAEDWLKAHFGRTWNLERITRYGREDIPVIERTIPSMSSNLTRTAYYEYVTVKGIIKMSLYCIRIETLEPDQWVEFLPTGAVYDYHANGDAKFTPYATRQKFIDLDYEKIRRFVPQMVRIKGAAPWNEESETHRQHQWFLLDELQNQFSEGVILLDGQDNVVKHPLAL
jgi:hypothetical protein